MEKLAGSSQSRPTPGAEIRNSVSSSSRTPAAPVTPQPQPAAAAPRATINIRPSAPAPAAANPFDKLVNRPSEGTPPVRPESDKFLKRPRAESSAQSSTKKVQVALGDEDIKSRSSRNSREEIWLSGTSWKPLCLWHQPPYKYGCHVILKNRSNVPQA